MLDPSHSLRDMLKNRLTTGLTEKRRLILVLLPCLLTLPAHAAAPTGRAKDDVPVRPRAHWAIQFETKSEKAYLEQIDALQIELGLVHLREPKIQYASKVSKKPILRSNVRRNEKRFYLAAVTEKEKEWETNVFAKQGIDTTHSLTIRYFPKQLVKKMMMLEDSACKELGLMPGVDVSRTQFAIKKTKDSWELVLVTVDRLK